ncbi:MAG TPA: hypothetical protein VMQ76_12355, partial [Terracidiphilus sp.]|nr:hypothetical protein [Terracidiphilus sp.]
NSTTIPNRKAVNLPRVVRCFIVPILQKVLARSCFPQPANQEKLTHEPTLKRTTPLIFSWGFYRNGPLGYELPLLNMKAKLIKNP